MFIRLNLKVDHLNLLVIRDLFILLSSLTMVISLQVAGMIAQLDFGKIPCKMHKFTIIFSMGKCNTIKGHVGSIRSLSFS